MDVHLGTAIEAAHKVELVGDARDARLDLNSSRLIFWRAARLAAEIHDLCMEVADDEALLGSLRGHQLQVHTGQMNAASQGLQGMKGQTTHQVVTRAMLHSDVAQLRWLGHCGVVSEALEEDLALGLRACPLTVSPLTGDETFFAASFSDRIQASSGSGILWKLLYIHAKTSFAHSLFELQRE